MWLELEERYGVFNGAQLFDLHTELTEVFQGKHSISTYFTKIKMLCNDIDSLCLLTVCSYGCKSGADPKLVQFQQEQRVIQFLMGLNESYNIMRVSILMRSPLPSLGHVYSLLLQEEAQRKINSPSHFLTDSAALNVHSKPTNHFNKFKSGNGDTKKSSLHYNYCKKPGHLIENCYKLHDFSSDFKFTKTKKITASVEGLFVDTTSIADGARPSTTLPIITPEFCTQLLQMLKTTQ